MLEGERVTIKGYFLFGITIPDRAHLICDECLVQTGFLIHVKSAESVSNNICFPRDALEVWRVFLYIESPLHDPVRVKHFVCQVLMISVDMDLLTQKNVSEFVQDFYNGE